MKKQSIVKLKYYRLCKTRNLEKVRTLPPKWDVTLQHPPFCPAMCHTVPQMLSKGQGGPVLSEFRKKQDFLLFFFLAFDSAVSLPSLWPFLGGSFRNAVCRTCKVRQSRP